MTLVLRYDDNQDIHSFPYVADSESISILCAAQGFDVTFCPEGGCITGQPAPGAFIVSINDMNVVPSPGDEEAWTLTNDYALSYTAMDITFVLDGQVETTDGLLDVIVQDIDASGLYELRLRDVRGLGVGRPATIWLSGRCK